MILALTLVAPATAMAASSGAPIGGSARPVTAASGALDAPSNERMRCRSSPAKPPRVTWSPPCRPACSAIEPAIGLAMIAFGSSTPHQFTPA